RFRLAFAPQMVGENDRPVEMRLFAPLKTAPQGFAISGERLLKPRKRTQLQAEIVPDVRLIGVGGEHLTIEANSLGGVARTDVFAGRIQNSARCLQVHVALFGPESDPSLVQSDGKVEQRETYINKINRLDVTPPKKQPISPHTAPNPG